MGEVKFFLKTYDFYDFIKDPKGNKNRLCSKTCVFDKVNKNYLKNKNNFCDRLKEGLQKQQASRSCRILPWCGGVSNEIIWGRPCAVKIHVNTKKWKILAYFLVFTACPPGYKRSRSSPWQMCT